MSTSALAVQLLREDHETWQGITNITGDERTALMAKFSQGEIALEIAPASQAPVAKGALRTWEYNSMRFVIPQRFVSVVEFFARRKADTQDVISTQDAALSTMLAGKHVLICGGPGTGKSHLISRFITEKRSLATSRPLRITVAAPTGKAAARFQHLGVTTQTIHRFLGMGSRGLPRYHAGFVAGVDILIVDEISMVDQGLFAMIVDALPRHAQIILAGDLGQLPAVDGRPIGPTLRFLTTHGLIAEARLSQVYRFSAARASAYAELQAKGIAGLAEGEKEILVRPIRKASEFADFLESYANRLRALIPEGAYTDTAAVMAALRQQVILTELRDGFFGSKEINRRLAALATELQITITPIIATANNYQLSVFNGDTGYLVNQSGKIEIVMENPDAAHRRFSPEEFHEWEMAFALTIHKAQGSEYENVYVFYDGKKSREDNRLVYTAVTRARNRATILVTNPPVAWST